MLAGPDPVFLRTARHPAAAGLVGVQTFDALYESSDTFERCTPQSSRSWCAAGRGRAGRLRGARLAQRGRAHGGAAAGRRAGRRHRHPRPVVPRPGLGRAGHRSAGPTVSGWSTRRISSWWREREGGPFLVAQAWSRHLLSDVKLSVGDRAEDELARPVLLHHLGLEDELVLAVDWWELDRTIEPDHLTSVYIPALGRADVSGGRGGTARGAHGHAARALPVGPGPDPRVAHAPPGRGVLRGPRRPGRAR